MRVLLIYNPDAGDGVHTQLRALVDLIHAAGHEVRCRSSKDPQVATAFAEAADLVAVAGGDGTVAKVARWLRGRKTPIAPLPLGTANNIAAALGLKTADLESQIQEWEGGRTVAMDVGMVRGARGSRIFLESVGTGLIARLVVGKADGPAQAPSVADRLERAVARARRMARRAPPVELNALLDGQDISGCYVLFEAMNIGWVGPNLHLADADPADGALELVLVRDSERALLVDWLCAHERGAAPRDALPRVRGRSLRLVQTDFALHVDDEVWTPERVRDESHATVEVALRDTICFRVCREQVVARPWMHQARVRDAAQPAERRNRRFELTPSRWASPAGRRVRFHR
jgi:diacylglycerol kinase family enzyme